MSDSHQARFPESEKTRQLVSALLKKKGISLQKKEAIPARPVYSPCPASFAQTRLWLLEQLAPGSRYNMQFALHLKGPLNFDSLSRAWQEVVQRHEILRTTFGFQDEEVMQFISPDPKSSLILLDLTKDGHAEHESTAQHLLGKQAAEKFDLAEGPLVRPVALKLGMEDFILSLTMHHIIADGWSLVVLVRDWTELYTAVNESRPHCLPPVTIQYADFAWWQRQRLRGEFLERQLSYWRRQLSNAPILDLPTDYPHSQKEEFHGAHCNFQISQEVAEKLRELGRRNHASLFMVLLAAWQMLLYRYSDQSDVVVGAPIANRTRVEIESLIGFFVNTLVLRTAIDGNLGFKELLSRVSTTTLDAYEHQDVPYEKLVAELQPERTAGQTPFFGTVLNWVNMPEANLEFAGMQSEFVQSVPLENLTAKFDLSLNVMETGGTLPAGLEYSTDLYEQATIQRMGQHLQNLLAAIVANPDQPVAELPLIKEEERSQILTQWNQTRREYPACGTVLSLLEAQTQKTPENPAVVFEGRSFSYRELHQRANQLAHFLQKLGVGPEVPVGVCMERSLELVLAVLGTMKAGGAYLPLDPSYPAERLKYMLEDSGPPPRHAQNQNLCAPGTPGPPPRHAQNQNLCAPGTPGPAVVLVGRGEREKLAGLGWGGQAVCVEEMWEKIGKESQAAVESGVGAENLAYVIYTSGSTGQPKGVMSTHGGLLNRLQWMQEAYGLEEGEGVLQKTPFGFDVSVWEFFWPLMRGGRLVVARPEGHKDSGYLVRTIQQERITTVHFVPSMLEVFVQEVGVEECRSLRRVISSGEALGALLVEKFHGRSGAALHNLYGPTEASIDVSFWACRREGREEKKEEKEKEAGQRIPIGRPIANTELYILDGRGAAVPVGVSGELYIGGVGLARGYWQRAELTAEKFIPDPFSGRAGGRLYRTGDLARWRSDGAIEYLGRTDHQVKLRGFRIELGEIEAVLRQHASVQQALVVVQDEGKEKKLIAYVVPPEGGSFSEPALRGYAQEKLPEYMVPAGYVELRALPLSEHGKVNRRELPRWEFKGGESKEERPRTPTEELVAGIWSEVLGAERIGIHDNFFERGGHSLLAMQVISRVRSTLQVELPFSAIFDAPTIHRLAAQIESSQREKKGDVLPPLIQGRHPGPHPLSFAQQRLWFMDRLHPDSTFYNISGALRLSGALDLAALKQALAIVAERHQVFRTRFVLENDEPVQIIEEDATLTLEHEDLRLLTPDKRETHLNDRIKEESQKPFDLGRAPLARIILQQLDEREYVLFMGMHHIISDGWSISVLIRELTELYAAFSQGGLCPLPPLAIQYADYAGWQREYLQGEVLAKHLHYWRTQLNNAPALELPGDRPRPAQETFRGAYYSFSIPPELATELQDLARCERATLFMVFLAAWQALLYRYSGQTDFVQGMPVANRSLPETEGLIGFFVNTLVVRANLAGDPSFTEVLQRTRKTTLEAYDHQDLPFEKLVADLRPERILGQTPLFRVMFNWVNTPPATLKFSGITWAPFPQQHNTSNFDLTFTVGKQDSALSAGFEYSTDLYDEETIARMANHLLVILRAVVEDPRRPVTIMPLLTEDERKQLLLEWNQTTADFGPARCVHELIELQAQTTPDFPAIVSDHEVITYGELDRHANQLAHWLQSRGVASESRVGVCLQRSPQMLVVLLGILKAGAAYVPLDPSYPLLRLEYMVEDSGLQLLLTEPALKDHLSFLPVEPIYVDLLRHELAREEAVPARLVTPENAAYIIYTSGSTGRSKGIIARHSSVANQVLWMKSAFELRSSDRVIHKASINFDASVGEIFAPLAAGAQVIVAGPEDHHDIHSLIRLMKTHKVTFIDLSPTLLHALLEHPEVQECNALRLVVSGGEVLTADLESRTAELLPTQLYNTYGPTETTVQSTFWACAPKRQSRSVPIGRPIANTQIYVLDRKGQPVPVGVEGELCIAGAGLARGYLNRPTLTAEKFVPNPFSSNPGERLYSTGDRVRWRRDAVLEFLGRTDQQTKVRGFRIEPGEIESALLTHSQVREAAVITRENNSSGQQIMAFVVPHQGPSLSVQELRQYVKNLLPFYMRPSQYMLMERLPLNANGKIDRNALALTQLPETTQPEVLPRTPTERILCGIWAAVLKRKEVGVEDDFFALGGHSFLAVSLISQIARCFGRDLALDKIFQYSTPREMARFIEQQEKNVQRSAVVCMNKGSDEIPPLYLMYPVGGNILCYADLAFFASPKKPFYAIQAVPDDLKHATVEEIAGSCLRMIQRKDRRGSYELGGWSFGGMLAFEMARQATAAGDPPATLYLLDPPILENISQDDQSPEGMVGLFVLTLITDFSGGKSLNVEELKAKFDLKETSLEVQLEKAAELGLLPARMDAALHAQSFEIFKRNMRAAQAYHPQKYSGKTTVILAELGRSEVWPVLSTANTSVAHVRGNHFTMLRGASAAKIAQLLDSGGGPVSL